MTWLLNPLVPTKHETGWARICDLDAMEKTVLPLLGIDPRFLGRPVRSIVTYTFFVILTYRLT